jgi:hypothetical protein
VSMALAAGSATTAMGYGSGRLRTSQYPRMGMCQDMPYP